MAPVRVCSPLSARKVAMKRAWKELREKEERGEVVTSLGELFKKHYRSLMEQLKKTKKCIVLPDEEE